jgi:predicted phage tail protein
MNVANYSELIRLIDCQTEGFKQYLIGAEENGIGFVFQRAGEYINDESELLLSLNDEDIILTAVPLGAGKKGGYMASGVGKIILGIIIVIIGYDIMHITGSPELVKLLAQIGGSMMATGGMLILQGIIQLLAPTSETEKKEEGWLMSGSANTVAQGQPVPLCYGELLVPGTPITVSYSNKPFNLTYLQFGAAHDGSFDGSMNASSYEVAQEESNDGVITSGGGSYNDQNDEYVQEAQA